jgi:chaperonin GroES
VPREVIVIGDKVLIKPEEAARTASGLFLPQGVAERENVTAGYVVNVGPGYPTVEMAPSDAEPWLRGGPKPELRYLPLQAQKGDYAVFLRREAVEVEIDEAKYLIVGHNAILLLVR